MTECWRISTPSRSASSAALRSGRTLKPMMMASEVDASSTSDRLIAPTPELMIRGIRGIDEGRGALLVSEEINEGTCVAFAVRDPNAARADLESTLRDV